MDDYKDIQAMLENMEREIKALKCSHSIAADIRMFTGWYYITNYDTPIIITYEDGENEIMTDIYGEGAALSTISNNQQKVFIAGNEYGTIIFVCSTRPILSITQ